MRLRMLRSITTILATSALVVSGFATAADAHGPRDVPRGFGSAERHQGHGHKPPKHGDGGGGSSEPVVLTNGLNNPRQLSLVKDKVLLIAEAGSGGSACSSGGPEGPICIGDTGSVGGVLFPQGGSNREHAELFTGLISGAGPDGSFAVGPDGVSQRDFHSPIYVQETFAPPDVIPAGLPGEQSGKLLAGEPFESLHEVADITAFEQAHDPDGQGPDSDPYAVVARKHDQLVADAAGNDILRVDKHGNVSLFHLFPNVVNSVTTTASGDWPGYDPTPEFPGANFVPTSIAIGKHGDVYVGGLSSLLPGQAEVAVLDGHSGALKQTLTGFTGVSGLAVDHHGTLYVSQLFAPEANPAVPQIQGVVTKITTDGTRHDVDVPFPAGLAVDHEGNVFVSAWSIAPATGLADAPPGFDTSGQVWRLRI